MRSFTATVLIFGFIHLGNVQSKESVQVTCGSTIKLENDRTGHLLHSHDVSYAGRQSSGQQSVTGYPERDSGGSLWIVRGAENDAYCEQGTPLKKGAQIRLQHAATRRWLHSHLFSSPLSRNQEISCFGSDDESDTGDVWILELVDKADQWNRDAIVRFKHKDTGVYLSNHETTYQRPIHGHSEIFGTKAQGPTAGWRAVEGARSDLGFDGCTLALSSLGGEYDGDMAVCGAVDNWKPERDLYNRERDQNWVWRITQILVLS